MNDCEKDKSIPLYQLVQTQSRYCNQQLSKDNKARITKLFRPMFSKTLVLIESRIEKYRPG